MLKYENMLDIDNLPTIGRFEVDISSIGELIEYKLMGVIKDNPIGYYYKNLLEPIMNIKDKYIARKEWLVDVEGGNKELKVNSVYENVFENLIDLINDGYEIFNENTGVRIFNSSQLGVIKRNPNTLSKSCRLPYMGLHIAKLFIEYLINVELAYVGKTKADIEFKSYLAQYLNLNNIDENEVSEYLDDLKIMIEEDTAINYIQGCIQDLMDANNNSLIGVPYGWNWNLYTVILSNRHLIINKGIDYRIYEWSVEQIHKGEGDENDN